MTTAQDTIAGALRLLGVVGPGQPVSSDDSATMLALLNEFLEDLSTQNLAIFTPVDQTFALVPGVSSYTVGPSGTFVGFRPIQIDTVRVLYQTIIYVIDMMDRDRFNAIPYPGQTGILPLEWNYDATATNGTLNIWPIPTTAMPIILTQNQQLAQIPTLATVLTFPPGYARMLRYNLAKEAQDEYGKQLSPTALQIAAKSLGDCKRANLTPAIANFDPALLGGPGYIGSYLANFIAGNL